MFGLVGVVALVVFVLARPLDFIETLRGLPFLYIFCALAVFGFIVDARFGLIKLRATPQLPWVIATVGVAVLAAAIMAPSSLQHGALGLSIVLVLYLVIGQGVQRLRALELVAGAVLASTLWIAVVCVHQGTTPLQCVANDQKDDHSAMGRPDGRSCVEIEQCYVDPPEPQAIYRCEHVGMLGITSVGGGRVRYLGVLHDPNEVALTVPAVIPLAIAFYQRKKNKARMLLVGATGLLAAITVVMSQSRGGVLVFLAVIAVYFIKRYGWRGALVGALLGAPVLLLGGRSDPAASASTDERLEVWQEGMEMVRAYPFFGVGHGQFTEHHHLTAHNSVLLAAAETGIFGAIVFVAVMYMSIKIPLRVLAEVDAPEGAEARIWATALLASLSAIAVGALLLSFTYHFVLWIYVGMAAGLWGAVSLHQPEFRVRFRTWDAVLVTASSLGLLAIIFVVSH